jgi:hypothetical protein
MVEENASNKIKMTETFNTPLKNNKNISPTK